MEICYLPLKTLDKKTNIHKNSPIPIRCGKEDYDSEESKSVDVQQMRKEKEGKDLSVEIIKDLGKQAEACLLI